MVEEVFARVPNIPYHNSKCLPLYTRNFTPDHDPQPPLEVLRQLVGAGGFYNVQKFFWQRIVDTTLIAAMSPPGGGRSEMPPVSSNA